MISAAHAAFAPLGGVTLRETRDAGDEARLVGEALDAGCRTIVAIGGDGTWSKVAAALAAARGDCTLALVAAGTGNDLAKSLGLPASPVAVATLVAGGASRPVDIGYVDDRCFVNAAGFGFDAAVLAAAATRRWPRGEALYITCALERLFGYRGVHVGIAAGREQRRLLLVVANGSRFGGSFRIAPAADPSDGLLDVVAVADAPPLQRVWLLAAAMRGAHAGLPGVSMGREQTLTLRFREPPQFQADGDLYRAATSEVMVRCVPAALRVVTSASSSALPAQPHESAR